MIFGLSFNLCTKLLTKAYNLLATRTNGTQAPLFTQPVALTVGKVYTLVLRGSAYPFAVAPEKLALDVVVD